MMKSENITKKWRRHSVCANWEFTKVEDNRQFLTALRGPVNQSASTIERSGPEHAQTECLRH